ncbi:MAG: glycosyltransferase [Candidatus Omnitrophota bacterium]
MKPNNILIIGNFATQETGENSFLRAFNSLNMDIKVVTFDTTRNILRRFLYNRKDGFFDKVKRRTAYLFYPYIIRRKFLDLVKKGAYKDIDLVLDFKSVWLRPGDILTFKKFSKAKFFHYNADSIFDSSVANRSRNLFRCLPYYDCYCCFMKELIPKIESAARMKRIEYFPLACDPKLHYPSELTAKELDYFGSDIAFIGNWTPERERWLTPLAKFDLNIWGDEATGWGRLAKGSPLRSKWKKQYARGRDYAKVCAASKIVVNFLRQGTTQQNMRTFEVPACGGFLLTQRSVEQITTFEESSEIACFNSPQELIEKIEYYLPKDKVREDMAKKAYEKVVKYHTYENRAKRLLEIYETTK